LEALKLLTALAVLVVLSTLGVSQVFAADDFSVYENSGMGVSIEYPSAWNFEESSGPAPTTAFYAPFEDDSDEFSENLTITVEPLGVKILPQFYADLTIENMKLIIPDLVLISSNPTQVSGKHFQKVIFEIPNLSGLEIKGMMMITVDDAVGYSVSYLAEKSSYDSYLPLVEQSIDSFSISGISDTPTEIEEFPVSQYLSYEDPEKGLTIKYPPNWQKTELTSSEIDVIFQSPLESISDVFAENSLMVIKKISGMSLTDYTEISLNNFETRPGLVGLPQDSSTTLAGLPAHQIKYTETDEFGTESSAWMVWTVANDLIYVIGFGSTPDAIDTYEPIFQNMIDSVEIEELDLPTPVSGTYSNSEIGLEIQLPDDWQGIEQQKDDLTMVIVSPGITMQPFAQGSQVSDKLEFSALTLIMGDYSQILEEMSSAVSEDTKCSSESAQIIELNSMKTLEILSDYEDPKLGTVKGLEYVFATKDDAIMAVYVAVSKNPGKTYDENIEKFKESLYTLTIKNTVDISNPFDYASTFDVTASKESVTIGGKTTDVLFASNSTISNVSFNEENNSLTFEPKGQSGTSGITEVYVGNVLEEPFAVLLGNNQIDDFIVVHDTTNGQTSINFEYKHPTGLVTVTVAQEKTAIPDWVRGNAEWWAQGAIGDSDFVSGIQFLIKEGIMTIPETTQGTTNDDSQEIPSWIKNNADWWAQGLISDDDFVKGIQFLIEQGIISI
jgi:hypothetical protein